MVVVQWFEEQPKEFLINGFHRWCNNVTILNSLSHFTQTVHERVSFEQVVLSKRD
jgi:hypothetical protein